MEKHDISCSGSFSRPVLQVSQQLLALPSHIVHPNAVATVRSLAAKPTTQTKGEIFFTRPDSSHLRKHLIHQPRNQFNLTQSLATSASLPNFYPSSISHLTELSNSLADESPEFKVNHSYDCDDSSVGSRPQSRMSTHSLPSTCTESASNTLFKPTDDHSIDIYIDEILKKASNLPLQTSTQNNIPSYPSHTRITYIQDVETALHYTIQSNNISGHIFSSEQVKIHNVNFRMIEKIIYRESLVEKMQDHLQQIQIKYWQYCIERIMLIEKGKNINNERLVSKRNEIFSMQSKLSVEIAHLRALTMSILEGIQKLRSYVHEDIQFHDTSISIYWKGVNYIMKMASDYEFLNNYSAVRRWFGFIPNPLMIPPRDHNPYQTWKLQVGLLFTHWLQVHKDKVHKDKKGQRHRRGFIIQDNKFILDNLQLLQEMEKTKLSTKPANDQVDSESSNGNSRANTTRKSTPNFNGIEEEGEQHNDQHNKISSNSDTVTTAHGLRLHRPKVFEPWEQIRDYAEYSWGVVENVSLDYLHKHFSTNSSLPNFIPSKLFIQSQEAAPFFWSNPNHNPYVVEAAIGFSEVFPNIYIVPPLPSDIHSKCVELMHLFDKEADTMLALHRKKEEAQFRKEQFESLQILPADAEGQPSLLNMNSVEEDEVEELLRNKELLKLRHQGSSEILSGISKYHLSYLHSIAYQPDHCLEEPSSFIVKKPSLLAGDDEDNSQMYVGEHIFSLTNHAQEPRLSTNHFTHSTSSVKKQMILAVDGEDDDRTNSHTNDSHSYNIYDTRDSSTVNTAENINELEVNVKRAHFDPFTCLPTSSTSPKKKTIQANVLGASLSIITDIGTHYPSYSLDSSNSQATKSIRDKLINKIKESRAVVINVPFFHSSTLEPALDMASKSNDSGDDASPPPLPRSLSISRIHTLNSSNESGHPAALTRINSISSSFSMDAYPHDNLQELATPKLTRTNSSVRPNLMRTASLTASSQPHLLVRNSSFVRQPSLKGGALDPVQSSAPAHTIMIKALRTDRKNQRELYRLDAKWITIHATHIQRIIRGYLAKKRVRKIRRIKTWKRTVAKIQGLIRGFVSRLKERRAENEAKIEVFLMRKQAYFRFRAAILITRWVRRHVNMIRLKKQEPFLYDKLDDQGRPLSRKESQRRLRQSLSTVNLEKMREEFLVKAKSEGLLTGIDHPELASPVYGSPQRSRASSRRSNRASTPLETIADEDSVNSHPPRILRSGSRMKSMSDDNASIQSSLQDNQSVASASIDENSQSDLGGQENEGSIDEFVRQKALEEKAKKLVHRMNKDKLPVEVLRSSRIIPLAQATQTFLSTSNGTPKKPKLSSKERVFLVPSEEQQESTLKPQSTVKSTFDVYVPPITYQKLNKNKKEFKAVKRNDIKSEQKGLEVDVDKNIANQTSSISQVLSGRNVQSTWQKKKEREAKETENLRNSLKSLFQ